MDKLFKHTMVLKVGIVVFSLLASCKALAQEPQGLIDSRFMPSEDGAYIIDTVTGFEWSRCYYGQTWDGTTCTGQPFVYDDGDLPPELLPASYRLPTISELQTLKFCTNKQQYHLYDELAFVTCESEWPSANVEAFPHEQISVHYLKTDGPSAYSLELGDYDKYYPDPPQQIIRLIKQWSYADFLTLSIEFAGTGQGTVDIWSNNTLVASCDQDCEVQVIQGSDVSLTANPALGNELILPCSVPNNPSSCSWSPLEQSSSVVVELNPTLPYMVDEHYFLSDYGNSVIDLKNGLEWKRCDMGLTWNGSFCAGTLAVPPWDDMLAYADADGFKIATIEQLRTLVRCESSRIYGNENSKDACDKGLVPRPSDDDWLDIEYFGLQINTQAFPGLSDSHGVPEYNNTHMYQSIGFESGATRRQDLQWSGWSDNARLVRDVNPIQTTSLNVNLDGDGGGYVESGLFEKRCDMSCVMQLPLQSYVVLYAFSDDESSFVGWQNCSSSNKTTCRVKVNEISQVSATFTNVGPQIIDNRFQIVEHGHVVRDLDTGLEWQRCLYGQIWNGSHCLGRPLRVPAEEGLVLTQPNGFSVPTSEELRSIVYCSNTGTYGVDVSPHPCGHFGSYNVPTQNESVFPLDGFGSATWKLYNANTHPATLLSSSVNGEENEQSADLVSFRTGELLNLDFLYIDGLSGSAVVDNNSIMAVRLVRRVARGPQLDVNVLGDSDVGRVISRDRKIDCRESCNSQFSWGEEVELLAKPDTFIEFGGWQGCDRVDGLTCFVRMESTQQVSVIFNERYDILENGAVVSDPATGTEWQRCSVGQTWNGTFCEGEVTRLTQDEFNDYVPPEGWKVASLELLRSLVYCENKSTYDLNLEAQENHCLGEQDPTANELLWIDRYYRKPTINEIAFPQSAYDYGSSTVYSDLWPDRFYIDFSSGQFDALDPNDTYTTLAIRLVRDNSSESYSLAVRKVGSAAAQGQVSSNIGSMSCGTSCETTLAAGTEVILTAQETTEIDFVRWEGCARARVRECKVVLERSYEVTAIFEKVSERVEAPQAYSATEITAQSFTANWQTISYADSYTLYVSRDNGGNEMVAGYDGLSVGNRNEIIVTGLSPNTTYYYWLTANFKNSQSIASNVIAVTTTLNTYDVTYLDWDGFQLAKVEVGSGYDAPYFEANARSGYQFTGWSPALTNVTADRVVTAQYAQQSLTVTFVDWDGTELSVVTVPYGGDATPPTSPSRQGYQFTGWSGSYTGVTSDVTISATYEIIPLTVTVSSSAGGTVSPLGAQNINSGASIEVNVVADSGFILEEPVGGSCPQGTLTGEFYLTPAITASCDISFNFVERLGPEKRRSNILLLIIEQLQKSDSTESLKDQK
ncbi:InlB B-repeat-containing protein [Pseudidiomarina salilacus]|uniref:InlB B-repeat-containing protein n=1 Tax=Pseudidiomarina salilacus TaxID=3384452 RepID=UPI0039852E59